MFAVLRDYIVVAASSTEQGEIQKEEFEIVGTEKKDGRAFKDTAVVARGYFLTGCISWFTLMSVPLFKRHWTVFRRVDSFRLLPIRGPLPSRL